MAVERHSTRSAGLFVEAQAFAATVGEAATLQRIVDLAVEAIDGCDQAAIALTDGRRIATSRAATLQDGQDAQAQAMVSFRLVADRDVLGFLRLHSAQPAPFSDVGEATGRMLAARAATVIAAERLRLVLDNREVIEVAKGVIMAKEGATAEEAFERLRAASEPLDVTLSDLAHRVAESRNPPSDLK